MEEKEPVNEVIGTIVIALGALVVGALAAFFSKYALYLKGIGKELDDADKKVKDVVEQLPPEVKTEFMKEYESAMASFKAQSEKLQKLGKEGALKEKVRPSATIAAEIQKVIAVITKLKTEHADALEKNPRLLAQLDAGINEMKKVYSKISSLDLFVAVASKEDANGLWKKLSGDQQKQLADESTWFKFAEKLVDGANIQKKELQPTARA